ncbi:LysR substrate-binding domain-containing protein [Yersinia sp. 2542 StPb PI]|uniref:LysR substrate-binding domain-containing protein n=1 Tax=Yersinia sp. 2542 StPb PI TaxID=3117408 RepID=UPI003B284961
MLIASPTLGLTQLDDLTTVTLFHVQNRHIPQPSPNWEHWRDQYGPKTLDIEASLRFTDETHAIQTAIAGQGVAIVSSLLAKDFIDKQILTVPFDMALPGGKYFFVTTQEKAPREDVRELKLWVEGSIAGR